MGNNNLHTIKNTSLFAMFCLSYFPLFFLLSLKFLIINSSYLNYGGLNKEAIYLFIENFGAVCVLSLLSIYAFFGTHITLRNIKKSASNAFPATIKSIKPKNDEALSYLVTYVIPLIAIETVGTFEYVTFIVLFIIYYKLYATSSLILINPILNMKYGLLDIEYEQGSNTNKQAMVIAENSNLIEGDTIKLIKISHRLYFAINSK
jgi:hypothetical protein